MARTRTVRVTKLRRQGGLSAPQVVNFALAVASAVAAFLAYTAISIIVGRELIVLGFLGPDITSSAPTAAAWVLMIWSGLMVASIFRCLKQSNNARFALMMLLGGIGLGTLILGLQSALVDKLDLVALLRILIVLFATSFSVIPIWWLTRRVSSTWFNV